MIFFFQFRKHFPGKQRKIGLSYEGFAAAPAGHAVFKQVNRLMGVSAAVVNFLIFENVVPIQTRDRWNLFQFQFEAALHCGERQCLFIFFIGQIPETLIFCGWFQHDAGVCHYLNKSIQKFIFQGKITDIRTVPIIVILILTDKKGHQRTAVIIESIQLMDKSQIFPIFMHLCLLYMLHQFRNTFYDIHFFISDTQGNRWRFSGNVQRWFQMDAADECTIGDHPVFLIAELAENLLHTVICPGGMSPDTFL